jgi:UDP-glucose 4-epimerase
VVDIARAHILALQQIEKFSGRAYNMGNGSGYSNLQVVAAAREVTGSSIPVIPASRRPGDPARLIASSDRIRRELGWAPHYPDLKSMVETAWAWRQKNPRGYDS